MQRRRAGSLEQALRYRNQDVVDKFAERFQLSDRESRGIFDDTKRWLWLSALPDRPALLITAPLQIIDEMWHTFVLFTSAYGEYCQRNLGGFIHHVPTTRRDRRRIERRLARDPELVARQRRRQAERQYRFIADKLGDRTLVRWYAEYPLRYDRAFFQRFGIEQPDLVQEAADRLAALLAPPQRPVSRAARSRGSSSS